MISLVHADESRRWRWKHVVGGGSMSLAVEVGVANVNV
jgi:hypothetical protein